MTEKLVPLAAWAASRYDPPPAASTLRFWAANDQIVPAPIKVGKGYRCKPSAKHINEIDAHGSLVRRTRG